MVDLTQIISGPQHNVEAWREANYQPRARLGLSECGHKCGRYLWYSHHGAPAIPPDGRILRLFRLGEWIEEQAAFDLQGAGYTLRDQQREVKITDGDITLYGHIDGIIEGLAESKKPHLWECKSASDKEWKRCAKVGYGAWNEKYKAQIHVYMLLLELTRALVWVENKNTSEVHTERINVDRGYAIKTLEKCFAAIQSDTAPDRSCPSAAWYEAKFCKYREVCFG